MVKILVTGSSGMLGTELCKVLTSDYEVVGIDIVRVKGQGSRVKTFYEVSITNLEQIKTIFDKEKPELIIHAAAWTDVDGCEKEPERAYEVNTTGTFNIAKISKEDNIPVIFISTDFVFNGQKNVPYTELDTCEPLNVYGKAKWEAEKILERDLTCYTIVRTSWLYGKNGRNFVDNIAKKSENQEQVQVVNDQIGSPTYARDLASAIRALVKAPVAFNNKEVYHISNIGQCSWYMFAIQILEDIDTKEAFIKPITSVELERPAYRPRFSVLDNSKFQKSIGYKMRSWQEALEEYLRERYGVKRK